VYGPCFTESNTLIGFRYTILLCNAVFRRLTKISYTLTLIEPVFASFCKVFLANLNGIKRADFMSLMADV